MKPDQAGVQISVGRKNHLAPETDLPRVRSWLNPKNWRVLVAIQSIDSTGVKTVLSVNRELEKNEAVLAALLTW